MTRDATPYRGDDKILFGLILGVLAFWLFAQTTSDAHGVIGIQPERVGELLLGRGEIPVIMRIRVPETRVHFGIVFV